MLTEILKKKPRGKPFQKGNNANPKGRPRNPDCLVDCLRKALSKPVGDTTWEQRIADKLVQMAASGDIKAIALAYEYTARKPDQGIIPPGGININLVSSIPRPGGA